MWLSKYCEEKTQATGLCDECVVLNNDERVFQVTMLTHVPSQMYISAIFL